MKLPSVSKIFGISLLVVNMALLPMSLSVLAQNNPSPATGTSPALQQNVDPSKPTPQGTGQATQNRIKATGQAAQDNINAAEQAAQSNINATGQATQQQIEAAQKNLDATSQAAQQRIEATAQRAEQVIADRVAETEQRANWGWLGLLGLLGLFGLLGKRKYRQDVVYSSETDRTTTTPPRY